MRFLVGLLWAVGYAIGALAIGFGAVMTARYFQLSKEATTFLAAGAVALAVLIRLTVFGRKASSTDPRDQDAKPAVSRKVWMFRVVGGLVTLRSMKARLIALPWALAAAGCVAIPASPVPVTQLSGPDPAESGSPGSIGAAPSPSTQRPQPMGTGWRINFDQSGSYPVLADGVLYVGSADGAVYALDPKNGETKWRFQTGESLSPATSRPNVIVGPRGTSAADQMAAGINAAERQRGEGFRRLDMAPAVENGTVFIGSGDQSFYAIDAATGQMKWSYVAGPGMASPTFLSIARPAAVLRSGTVYFETARGLHALDALTGKRKWLFDTPHSYDTPKGPVLGDSVIFLTAGKSLFAIDPQSGATKWTWVAGMDSRDISARTAAKGLVFVAVNERPTLPVRPNRATLYAINATDGQVKWTVGAETVWGARTLFIAGDRIYFSTDTSLLALELETGRQLWNVSADDIRAPLQADARHLYLMTYKDSLIRSNRTLRALALATGEEKWSRGLSGNASIETVQDGAVYAGAHAVDAATGNALWSFSGTGRESARLVSGGRIFLTSPTVTYIQSTRVDQGYLYAIDPKTGGLESR